MNDQDKHGAKRRPPLPPVVAETLVEETPAPEPVPAPVDTYQPTPRRCAPQE